MINDQHIQEALQPPSDWTDTPEQAQLRSCLVAVLSGHEPVDTIRICYDLITLMRDQLMAGAAHVRRTAASSARETMNLADLAIASGQTRATISRLLTESKQ